MHGRAVDIYSVESENPWTEAEFDVLKELVLLSPPTGLPALKTITSMLLGEEVFF
jgi:hypothetical protein